MRFTPATLPPAAGAVDLTPARGEGRDVLVLDAVTGGDAARLYARCGWTAVGDIPRYALTPDGAPCSTTYFYKHLPSRSGE